MRTKPTHRLHLLALSASLLAGCSVTPAYHTPSTPQPLAFKEAQGWVPAAPADTLERGQWWMLFNDPVLTGLVENVDVSNQTVAAAVAAYDQARALVQQQRASLFPSVSLNTSANRTGGGEAGAGNRYNLDIGGSWEPDVWGRLRANVSAAQASAQASQADLASARLSAQGELAADYFSLRASDATLALLNTTIEGYQRALQITTNRYKAGIAAHSDVLQAQTQLANAQADQQAVVRQRAQLEHAIAVLAGKAPAEFAIAPTATWQVVVPEVPVGVPSTLLQRRPDIAASERRVAAANAQIGVARSAYFPNIGLTASYGTGSTHSFADLFKVSNAVWSFGFSAAETLFNAGATGAAVSGAEAGQRQAAARYRQTVLAAFQNVEDQLSASRVLASQQDLRRQASEAADQVEQQMVNRYKAGQVSYTDVINAQVTALNARRNLVQVQSDRQSAAVSLIQALGGGWHEPQ
ncbi:efflux transporter outer membrane subunit [Massilia terrae]|uniref:Efflux transporter outer membrane subunit n=1 Tax=Massilia terrae TaxID=1811224 RepID=A0ABT2CRN2_9BURK|nr:efflux transporter outer membrane subunit [Massilia terrae]MCS0656622.1 efflux transporter outer membrane subunit [Massilia terrae]